MTGIAELLLYWLPLGAGGSALVRSSGRVYEAVAAWRTHRRPGALYHSALRATVGSETYVVEVAPAWDGSASAGVVAASGPVGSAMLGRSVWFRYEVRCWLNGSIPDEAYAVDSPVSIPTDAERTHRLLGLVGAVPTVVWGRDQLGTGEMWNSNSVVAWLLLRSGHALATAPSGGRAPGWAAGEEFAGRQLRRTALATDQRTTMLD